MTMISIADTKNSLFHGGFKAFQGDILASHGEIDIVYRERSSTAMCSPVREYRSKVIIERGSMAKELSWIDNNLQYSVDYGKYIQDKRFKKEHYRRASIHGNDGIIRKNTDLFQKYEGMCESLYVQGRLISQRFIYPNGRIAYSLKPNSADIQILHPNGKVIMNFKPFQKLQSPKYHGSPLPNSFKEYRNCSIEEWNGNGALLQRGQKKDGKKEGLWIETKYVHIPKPIVKRMKASHLREEGEYENEQRIGTWLIDGKEYVYHRGTAIPKELWEKPKEELDLKDVLKIDNTQVRSLLLEKAEATPEKIASLGELIHQATQMMARRKKKKMRLYSVKVPNDDPMKFLQVECPSTDTKYFLRVPPTATKCHEALQWTYGRGRIFQKQLKFVEET
ncbi:MAG: hypothetical protein PHT32_06480 [Candidatus Omnitrophica bacterium]|nr:hypothetical protein [Candidatus Omnitrophota bacterium]